MKLKAILAMTGILFVIGTVIFLTVRTNISVYTKKTARLVLQPTPDVPGSLVDSLYAWLKRTDSSIVLRKAVSFPKSSFYPPRARFRADSIIRWFSRNSPADETVIVVTTWDISTTKGDKKDWGVIGLGLCPGNACVVSTFRLSKTNTLEQLYKICLHELGHTKGLPHCGVTYCYMRDAEGHNVTDELNRFCIKCNMKMGMPNKTNTLTGQ